MKCLFKKNNNYNKLLLLCNAATDGQKSLGKINTNKLNNINSTRKVTEYPELTSSFYKAFNSCVNCIKYLSKNKIYPKSFSKVGSIYKKEMEMCYVK